MSRKYFKGNFSHQASGGSDGEFDDVDIQQLDWVEGNRKVFNKTPLPRQFLLLSFRSGHSSSTRLPCNYPALFRKKTVFDIGHMTIILCKYVDEMLSHYGCVMNTNRTRPSKQFEFCDYLFD